MKHYRISLFGLMVMVAFVVSSCSTTSINKLDGQWQLFWINDLGDGVLNPSNPQCNDNIYIWDFNNGDLTILMFAPPTPANPNPQPVIGARATYKTSAEFLDAVVEISDYVQSNTDPCVIPMLSNGRWTIDKIDDEVMRLGTSDQPGSGGSYVIREFTRVK